MFDSMMRTFMCYFQSERFCAQPPCGQFNPNMKMAFVLEAFLRAMSSWFPSDIWHLGYVLHNLNFAEIRITFNYGLDLTK